MTLCDVSLYNIGFFNEKKLQIWLNLKKKIPFFLDVMNLLNEWKMSKLHLT